MNNFSEPIVVDFNSVDEDGAVWLNSPVIMDDLQRLGVSLAEGTIVWLTDNDVEMKGVLVYRADRWVAIPDGEGFKPVPKTPLIV